MSYCNSSLINGTVTISGQLKIVKANLLVEHFVQFGRTKSIFWKMWKNKKFYKPNTWNNPFQITEYLGTCRTAKYWAEWGNIKTIKYTFLVVSVSSEKLNCQSSSIINKNLRIACKFKFIEKDKLIIYDVIEFSFHIWPFGSIFRCQLFTPRLLQKNGINSIPYYTKT